MVGHQHIGVNQPTRLLTGFVQCREVQSPPVIIQKGILSIVPPAHRMIDSSGVFDSYGSRHTAQLSRLLRIVNV